MRLSSPRPRDWIRVPQRRHGRPTRSIDPRVLRVAAPLGRGLHQRADGAHRGQGLVVRHVLQPPAGIHARMEARLRAPDVADSRQRALVEQSVPERSRAVVPAQPRQVAALVEVVCQQVGPEAGDALVEASAGLGHQLEHGAVELHHLVLGGADHEPGAVRRAPPALAPPVDAPEPAHAQVGVQGEVALEAQEEVLAARVDGADAPPGQAIRPAIHPVARMRRLDRHDLWPTSAAPTRRAALWIVSPSGI